MLVSFQHGKHHALRSADNLFPLHDVFPLNLENLVQQELEKPKVMTLHPAIDFHENIGLTYDTLLWKSSRNLVISKEKTFTPNFKRFEIQEAFVSHLQAGEVSISAFQKSYNEQMLLQS